ncbi:MAG: hypothetical protein ACI9DC_005656 [Gammaproteobacteria bacterium]|jgi:hypothetical protein
MVRIERSFSPRMDGIVNSTPVRRPEAVGSHLLGG